ncbi:MAG: PaaI family thioesterase [Syntrophomonas sp.]
MSIENRGIDEGLFRRLCNFWAAAPTHQTLDVKLNYLGPGEVGIKIKPNIGYTTVKGRVHGGIIATIADTAMGWAILSLGRNCVTVDMYINYFNPVFWENELIAEGKIVHSGNRTVVTEATLSNENGDLIAKSRGTFSLKKGSIQENNQCD